MSTYPRRPKAKALSNAVDVVERLRDPTDQVPNAHHLRVLHTFSSMTSLELLIQQSVVESKRQEFRNLKQGSLSVYQYNIMFQKLARFAKQDVPDEKSMIYQFRGGLREEIQLALVLFEPLRYDEFYNMALKQEAAQLRCDASKKRARDVTTSYYTQGDKQKKC